MRVINVAAAQLGPIQKADSREAVVKRMIALMDEAKAKGADLIVYPELALTTFFPRWYMEDQAEVDPWFEREMPNAATRPLFERAAQHQMAMNFGYAELTPDGHHFNTCILTDKIRKDRRKVPQDSSAGPFGVRYRARLPASGEALLRARRSRLQRLAHARRHPRHGDLQRSPLAGDLSRDGPARRRDGADRLQHAFGQCREERGGAGEAAVPQSPVRAGRRLPELDLGRVASPRPASRMAIP